MTDQSRIRFPQFYITTPQPCPYLAGRYEKKVFTHLLGDDPVALNNMLTQAGFRRSQNIAYRPACDNCTACVSVRVIVNRFAPGRTFRRLIARNAASLGTPHLDLIEGPAPEAYGEIKGAPDAIFLGGGVSKPGMAEIAWERLAPGGMLVANAVTMESETRLAGLFADWGGDLARIAVSRLEPVGPYHGWRPLMPVTQYSIRKPV